MIKLIEAYLDENNRQKSTIRASLRIMMTHMLKCLGQPEYLNKASWVKSILNGLDKIIEEFDEVGKGALYKNFYLKRVDLQEIYERSLIRASFETGKSKSDFPKTCPWSKEQLINRTFIEGFINEHGRDN